MDCCDFHVLCGWDHHFEPWNPWTTCCYMSLNGKIVASLNQQAYVAWLLVACGLSLYRYIIACFFLELQGQDIDPPTIMVQWRNFTPLKITFGSISIFQMKLLFVPFSVGILWKKWGQAVSYLLSRSLLYLGDSPPNLLPSWLKPEPVPTLAPCAVATALCEAAHGRSCKRP